MRMLLVALALVALVTGCKKKGKSFSLGLKEDAAVKVTEPPAPTDAPPPPAEVKASKVVVGDHFTCVLLTDATLRCWGRNKVGELGNGTTTDAPAPVQVRLNGVKDVVVGTAHVCALLDDTSVTCWGRIYFGKKENLLAPTAVAGVAKAKRLFAVRTASCATLEDESLVCWGDIDTRGHLKLSGGSMNRVATPSNGLDHVVAMSANGALKEDGTVWFWGANGEPVKTALTNVVEIAATGDEVCGLRRDGSVACAGPATRCAAAAPKVAAPKPAPKPIKKAPAPKPAKKAAPKTAKKAPAKKPAAKKPVAKKPAVAAKAPAKPAPPVEHLMPIELLRLPPAKHLAFDVGLCVVTTSGRLQCLAPKNGCEVEAPWPGLASVDYVVGNCARISDGSARCWSVDTKSRLVTAAKGVSGAISVAASQSHACAILGDRALVCWGSNKSGALGRGNADEQAHAEASAVTL